MFDTDATGVPASTPVQATLAKQLIRSAINPAGTFFYSVAMGTVNSNFTTNYAIVRNVIDPANGSLSQAVTEATYTLDSDVSGNDCYLEILGFNPAGTTLYDAILCSGPHGSGSETFNQRSVDLQTGALGTGRATLYVLLLCRQRLRRSAVLRETGCDPFVWLPTVLLSRQTEAEHHLANL